LVSEIGIARWRADLRRTNTVWRDVPEGYACPVVFTASAEGLITWSGSAQSEWIAQDAGDGE
jgi:hypothetical protein